MIVKNKAKIDTVYKADKKNLGQGTYGTVCGATHLETG
jgi:hypothetical protein